MASPLMFWSPPVSYTASTSCQFSPASSKALAAHAALICKALTLPSTRKGYS